MRHTAAAYGSQHTRIHINGMRSYFQSFSPRPWSESMSTHQSVLQRARLQIEQNDLMLIAVTYNLIRKRKFFLKNHRWWVHDTLKRREEQGAYQHLAREMGRGSSNTSGWLKSSLPRSCSMLRRIWSSTVCAEKWFAHDSDWLFLCS